jgi:very-short-patch-repair endonuclease
MTRVVIPYNSKLKLLAKKLRQRMTFSEVKLWNELKNGKMMCYDFDRQKVIGNYIVDFYCKDLMLAIEIDGITHTQESIAAKDILRQKDLELLGVNFIRVDAMLVVNKVEAAVREIARWIEVHEEKNGVPGLVKQKRLRFQNPPPSKSSL